jgi:LuxR family transcriptional regulator, maltose regulon positive regulatory protein
VPGPLLETKLYLPRSPRGLVSRPRLTERLERGAGSRLSLVSAPAGFGKSTLLAEWLAAGPDGRAGGRTAAWLSLDRADNSPRTFWTYVVAALRTAAPGVGTAATALLQDPVQQPIETVLTTLLNDLAALSGDLVLVLDDYHLIDSVEVQAGMVFLLDHLPPRLHLVLSGRSDPALPLARMRARGELVETRAADLRFTAEEAAGYLNEVMGLRLTADDVAALEGRTEGWIAALQLAALSMQGRDDPAAFIDGFTGDDRYVVDYLVEEVLQRQPEEVRAFLLQTSVLGRLSGPLCDAVTGRSGGRAMLETLERGNLFLVPLDDRRQWYRYHHLFADMLQTRLLDEHPDLAPDLHRRAGSWFDQHGEREVAIHHALAGKDFERAAELVERAIPTMRRHRREATLLGWLAQLPDELFRVRPVLSIGHVGALLACGETDGVETRLRDAERWLGAPEPGPGSADPVAGPVVLDDEEFRRLPSWVAVYRAGQAMALGDPASTVTRARQALELLDRDDHLGQGAAAALLGLASWAGGDLDAAEQGYLDAMASLRRAGHAADLLGCAIALADIRIAQGRLGAAMLVYQDGLRLASEQPGPALRGAADVHVGISALHCEHGDLAGATEHLLASQEFGEQNGLPRNPYRWCVAMARIRVGQGDPAGAVDLLDQATRLYVADFYPDVRPVPASRARVWLQVGRLDDAVDWARRQGLSAGDDLTYLREYEHLTLARVLLARHRAGHAAGALEEAVGLLERLLRGAEDGGRTGSVIEVLALQALAQQARGDLPAALDALRRALLLAAPERYVRLLLDEGDPMRALLDAVARPGTAAGHEGAAAYARRLSAGWRPAETTAAGQPLVEPLSTRELEVLRLLATDLGGPEIARTLVVSVNTVRTHTKSIFTKLGVNNRRAAVRRADELGLLPRR